MSKKHIDDCGGLKPVVIPKRKETKKATAKKPAPKKK